MEDWVKDFCDWNPAESPVKPVSRARRKTQSQSRRRSLRILRRQSIDRTALNATQYGESQTDNTGLFLQGTHDVSVSQSDRQVDDDLAVTADARSCDDDDYGTVWLCVNVDQGHEAEGKPAKRRKPSDDTDHHEIGQQNIMPQNCNSNDPLLMKDRLKNPVTGDPSYEILTNTDGADHMSSASQFREDVEKIWSDLNAFGGFSEASTTVKKKTEVLSTVKKRRQSGIRNRRRTIGIPSVSCKSLQPLLITSPDYKFNSSKFQPAIASGLSTKISVQLMAEELESPETCRSATPEVQARDMSRNLLALEDKSSEVMNFTDAPGYEPASQSTDLDKGFMSSPFVLDQDVSVFSPSTPQPLPDLCVESMAKAAEMKTSEPVNTEMIIDLTESPCRHTLNDDSVGLHGTAGTFTNIAGKSDRQQPAPSSDCGLGTPTTYGIHNESESSESRLPVTPARKCISDRSVPGHIDNMPAIICISDSPVPRIPHMSSISFISDNSVPRHTDTSAISCVSDSPVPRLPDMPYISYISDSSVPIHIGTPAVSCISDSYVPGHIGTPVVSCISDSSVPRVLDTPVEACLSGSSVPGLTRSFTDYSEGELNVRVSRLSGISEDFVDEMECDVDEDRTETSENTTSQEMYDFTAIRDIPAPEQQVDDGSSVSVTKTIYSGVPQEMKDNVSMPSPLQMSAEISSPVIENFVTTYTTLSSLQSPEDTCMSITPTCPPEDDKAPVKPRSRKRKRLSAESATLLSGRLSSMLSNPEQDVTVDDPQPCLSESCDQLTGSRRSSRLKRRSVELFREQRKISETIFDKTGSPNLTVCSEDTDSPRASVQEVNLVPKEGTLKASVKLSRKKRVKKAEKLEDIYLNKLYKKPNEKMYETIFENPVQQRLISQKRYRRSITFDMYTVQPSKVKKRIQKATKLGWGPSARRKRTMSKSDFDRKLSALEADLGNLNTDMGLQETCSETDTITVDPPPGASGDR